MASTPEPGDMRSAELGALAGTLAGTLHQPGSDGYRDRTRPKNSAGRQAPGGVVAAANPDDVGACVAWAREHG